MAIIELKKICRSYQLGKTELLVLKDIDLTIEEGQFVAIMGPSGSGKSTLMQIMGLLDRPSKGTYHLMGRDVSKLTDDQGAALRCKMIGFIFQMFNLLPRTSALDNVILPMIYSGEPSRKEHAHELLEKVGLSDRLNHKPNELSGGQQQRVAIARALVNRPRIVFADEPTGNLASDQAEEILGNLKELNDMGITVIMVTHDPETAAHAGRIIHIKDGRIQSDTVKSSPPSFKNQESRMVEDHAEKLHAQHSLFPPFSEIREFSHSALGAILSNKTRSMLSMLGILIGVAAVIAMLAIGKGAQQAVESRLSSLGSNLLIMMPGSPRSHGVHREAGSASRLTMEDIRAISKINPKIIHVDGNVNGNSQVVYGGKNVNTQVTGAMPVYEFMRASKPYHGRFFTDMENNSQARVVLLGATVVNNLFGQEDPVGKMVKVNRIHFQVIGVLPLKGAGGFRDQDDMILIPLNTAMTRVLGKKYLNMIAIECASAEDMPQIMEDVRVLMRQRHRLPLFKEDDFHLRNMADIQAAVAGTTKTFTLLLGIVAAISLLVGGIGIMNIMLVSVTERTREIGLRKAVGAARRAILAQFLIEAVLLSVIGGLIGILLGTMVSLILSKLAGWSAIVVPHAVFLAFIFSAGVGILFGFWPARKASLLSPIEALRYE